MKIYKIFPDYKNFYAFQLPMKDLLFAMKDSVPPQKLMHFYKHNLSLGDYWKDIHGGFAPVDVVTQGYAIPDVTTWVPGTLVFSNEAVAALEWLRQAGELLPVATSKGQYWVLNCSAVAAANQLKSERIVEKGQVLDVGKIDFLLESVGSNHIFKTDYDGFRNVFCSEAFKRDLEKNGFRGLLFSDELAGAF